MSRKPSCVLIVTRVEPKVTVRVATESFADIRHGRESLEKCSPIDENRMQRSQIGPCLIESFEQELVHLTVCWPLLALKYGYDVLKVRK